MAYQTAAHIYSTSRPQYPPELFSKIRAELTTGFNNRYVDLGCGTGELLLPISAGFKSSTGIDPEVQMLDQARSKLADHNASIGLYHGTAEEYFASIPGHLKFDLVTAGRSFHWMDHDKILRRLHRHLRSDGLFITVGENDGGIWNRNADWAQEMKNLILKDLHLQEQFTPTNGIQIDWRKTKEKLCTLGTLRELEFKSRLLFSTEQIINLYLSSAGLFEYLGAEVDNFRSAARTLLSGMNSGNEFVFDFTIGMTIVRKTDCVQ